MVAGESTQSPTLAYKYFLCSAYTSPQLVAIETASKGQAFWKFIKTFYNTPSLIQRNSEGSCTTKKRTVYKLFTSYPLLYLPIYRTVERIKLQTTSHFICRFAMGSLRINCIFLYQYKGNSKRFLVGCFAKVSSLNSHENGVLTGCFFKNSKYVYNLTSHLVAVGKA